MPSSSRDTGTIKFGGENVPETILRLVIAFFIDKTSNKKQIYIENTPNMVFIFFHAKTGSLPILQECPNHLRKGKIVPISHKMIMVRLGGVAPPPP